MHLTYTNTFLRPFLHSMLLTVFVVHQFVDHQFAEALKCKCTQSSQKTPCSKDGICEVTNDSACLMLDHPFSGRHYACSATVLKGECTEKITKTGATVKVCSCNSSDFCNFKLWPTQNDGNDEYEASEDDETEMSRPKPPPIREARREELNSATTYKLTSTSSFLLLFTIIVSLTTWISTR